MGKCKRVTVGLIGAMLGIVACGESSDNPGNQSGGAGELGAGTTGVNGGGSGGAGAGGAAGSAGTGTVCQGSDCPPVGNVSPAEACRAYMAAVCARVRECGAPLFRPCLSPIDVCPDILFADGSGFDVPGVVACTEQWKTHDCGALQTDQGPLCSRVPGTRAAAARCVFDAQCQSGRCRGGVSPGYDATCGVCVEVAPSRQACSEQRVCPSGESCENGLCVAATSTPADPCSAVACPEDETCSRGACVPRLATGAECSRASECAATLGCQIALVPEPAPEPTRGVCQPLPAIGQPCLPTFGHSGLCAAGGTCDRRPTGMCVPLVQIGGSCGYTSCVEGAYCNVLSYNHVPSHICYALGRTGDACDGNGFDGGDTACAKGFDCRCSDAACTAASCQPSPHGEDACSRATDFGREDSTCALGEECLCLDVECAAPRCGTARNFGESCDNVDTICRQGLRCEGGRCVEADRDIETMSCSAP